MEVRLLGCVEVSGREGMVDLGAPQQRCVFAALAMVPGQSLTIETLVERVWGEAVPVDVRAMLYTYVSRLRGALQKADPRRGRGSLRRRDGGYALDVDPDTIDLHRARRLASEARALAQGVPAGDAAAADLLDRACSLWAGMPLAGIDSDWVARVRTGLEQERLAMLTERFAAAVRIGQHDAVLGSLSQSLANHPLNESLAELLMLALYRSGRQADALEVFAQLHRRLVDEIGDGPGPAVRRLHQLILRRDGVLDAQQPPTGDGDAPAAPVPAQPAAAPWVPLCQLPPDSPRLVGRRELVRDLSAAVTADHPDAATVAVVSGPPGIGKTALATRVAHRVREHFPDGQWYVELGGAAAPREPGEVLAELLEATGVSASAVPAGTEGRAAALRARLADRRVLLVLDGARDASQVRPMLPGTPGSRVLVTSRWLLSGLDNATSTRLGPLGDADAVALLGQWAGSERVAREPAATAELGAACSGNPLALRIAAVRLDLHPHWPVARCAQRLRDPRRRLDELAVGDLDARASLHESYRSLDEPLRTALRRLGLVAHLDVAAWTVGALAGTPDGLRLVEGLVGASLLDAAGADATGEPRYRLHGMVAEYAAELAGQDSPSEVRAALRRRLDALLTLAGACRRRRQAPAAEPEAAVRGAPAGLCDAEASRLTAQPAAWLHAERDQLVDALEGACRLGWHAAAASLAKRALTDALRAELGAREVARLLAAVRDAALHAGDEGVARRIQARLRVQAGVHEPVVPLSLEPSRGVPALERLDA